MLKKLLGLLNDTLVYGASSALSQIIGLLLLPIYTKLLTRADFGLLGMLVLLGTLFGPLARLGMTNAIFRRFSVERDPAARARVLTTGLVSVTVSSLCLGIMGFLFADFLARDFIRAPDSADLVRITMFGCILGVIGDVPMAALRAARRVKTIAWINITSLLFTTLVTIWLVVERGMGVRGAVIGPVASGVVFLVVQLITAAPLLSQWPNRATWRTMIRYGLPFVPHHLQAVGLVWFSQYMVELMLGLDEFGLYSVAGRFAAPVAFVVNAVQNSWVAYKFHIHAEDDNPAAFFRSCFTYYAVIVSYLWVGSAFWGPEVLRLMSAPEFHGAVAFIPLLALVPIAQGVYFMLGTGVEFRDDTRFFPLISFFGLLSVVGVSMWAIPVWGANGASVASVCGSITMALIVLYFARQRFPIPYDWPALGCLALGMAVCGGISVMVQPFGLVTRLVVATTFSILYPLFALGVLWASPSERSRLRRVPSEARRLLAKRSARIETALEEGLVETESLAASPLQAAPPLIQESATDVYGND